MAVGWRVWEVPSVSGADRQDTRIDLVISCGHLGPHEPGELERWRLPLGQAGDACTGGVGLAGASAARDAALDWLYQRDNDLHRRGIRRSAGLGPSVLSTFDSLDDINRLFPKETVERLERDAIERYDLTDVVTDPNVLERIEPNPTLLKAVLQNI